MNGIKNNLTRTGRPAQLTLMFVCCQDVYDMINVKTCSTELCDNT